MKKVLIICLILVTLTLTLSGCAAENPMTNKSPEDNGRVRGFFAGLWDGIIAVPAFVINLIAGKHGSFYNVYNNGSWYNFGFLIGIGAFVGGCSSAASSKHN